MKHDYFEHNTRYIFGQELLGLLLKHIFDFVKISRGPLNELMFWDFSRAPYICKKIKAIWREKKRIIYVISQSRFYILRHLRYYRDLVTACLKMGAEKL